MTTHNDDQLVEARQRINGKTMAAISPLPPPEEVFADWLMSVPAGVSLDVAAQRQIEVIDRKGLRHPDVQILRTLLAVVACSGEWPKPVANL
ncbi:hypothetical protein MAUB1S_05323 [Mycolicibacterium aubagnense]